MKKVIATILIFALALGIGYNIGRHDTIRQAELLEITDTEYYINFGNDVHIYTFEGWRN